MSDQGIYHKPGPDRHAISIEVSFVYISGRSVKAKIPVNYIIYLTYL